MEKIALAIIQKIRKYGIPDHVKKWNPQKHSSIKNGIDLWKLIKSYHHHSKFFPIPKEIKRPTPKWWEKDDNPLPKFTKVDDIGHFQFYQFFGQNNKAEASIIKFVQMNLKDLNGLILDFRFHAGGNMWPHVNALKSLLRDSTLLSFSKTPDDENWVKMDKNGKIRYEQKTKGSNKLPNMKIPVAILFGPNTESSGEILAAIFAERNNKNIKSFGKPSSGYLSSNNFIPINKEITLVLTAHRIITVNNVYHRKEKLYPDVNTKSPVKEALKWIRNVLKNDT